jgi:hypothetical protein
MCSRGPAACATRLARMGSWADRTMRGTASSPDCPSTITGRYLDRGTRARQRRHKSRRSGRHLSLDQLSSGGDQQRVKGLQRVRWTHLRRRRKGWYRHSTQLRHGQSGTGCGLRC